MNFNDDGMKGNRLKIEPVKTKGNACNFAVVAAVVAVEANDKVKEPGSVPVEVELVNGVPVVSSKRVAEVFGKEHSKVCDKIKGLIKNINDLGGLVHDAKFCAMQISTPTSNGGHRTDDAFMLTRDAFSLLVFGFEGQRALRWKLDYITAFNQMEKALIEQAKVPAVIHSTQPGVFAMIDELERRLPAMVTPVIETYQAKLFVRQQEEWADLGMNVEKSVRESIAGVGQSVNDLKRELDEVRVQLGWADMRLKRITGEVLSTKEERAKKTFAKSIRKRIVDSIHRAVDEGKVKDHLQAFSTVYTRFKSEFGVDPYAGDRSLPVIERIEKLGMMNELYTTVVMQYFPKEGPASIAL